MAVAFDPNNLGSDITLSNNNRTATKGSVIAFAAALCTVAQSTGNWYFEIIPSASSDHIGLAQTGINMNAQLGSDVYGWAWTYMPPATSHSVRKHNGAYDNYGEDILSGDNVGVAYNLTLGMMWVRLNGVWQESGDPVAGTNPMYSGITGPVYPAVSLQWSNNSATINATSAQCSYTAPTGYNYLSSVISGVLKEKEGDATGAAYDYAVIKRSDGSLLAAGTADANGLYSVDVPDTAEYDIIELDGSGVYSPKIIEGVTGV